MFKSCGAKVFSLRIYLSLWYLPAAAVLILFCNMDIVLISFKVWLSWKCFESSLLLACFWCCSNVWRSALKVAPLYLWYIRACASNIVQGHLFPFLAVSSTFYFFLLCLIAISDEFGCIHLPAKVAFSSSSYVEMKLLICNIVLQNTIWKGFIFFVGDSRFLFENFWQFGIARD